MVNFYIGMTLFLAFAGFTIWGPVNYYLKLNKQDMTESYPPLFTTLRRHYDSSYNGDYGCIYFRKSEIHLAGAIQEVEYRVRQDKSI